MRVLHCIPSMLGGGAERQLCYLSSGLVALGHDVHVALMREGPNAPRLRASGAVVHLLPERTRYDVMVLADLCSLIDRTGADVVQTWLARMDMWGGLAARAMGKPWVYSERNVWVTEESWLDALRRRIVLHASGIVANSDAGAAFWRRAASRPETVHMVPNTLPLAEIREAPRADLANLGVAPDAEVVLYTGRFMPNKNIGLLAEVLTAVLRERPSAVAICCGEGPLLGSLAEALRVGGVSDRCRLLGYRTDVWSIMKVADVSLSTSDREGRPNALLEAMACGSTVVASDIPQHREIIGEDAGLFFSAGSASGGAAAVAAALDDRASSALRARRAMEAVLATASPSAVAETYTTIYRSLTHGGGSGP